MARVAAWRTVEEIKAITLIYEVIGRVKQKICTRHR
jgi:hypothetical protein